MLPFPREVHFLPLKGKGCCVSLGTGSGWLGTLVPDSKPLLESISSTHQVEEKLLRNSITDMKDSLYEKIVTSFSWLDGEKDMVADVMTKECKDNKDLSDIVMKNKWRNVFNEDNVVKNKDGEIRMFNRKNKT